MTYSTTLHSGPSGLADDLRYIAAMLHANRDKFAVPDHIAAKVAKLHKAANALTPQPGEAAALERVEEALIGLVYSETQRKAVARAAIAALVPADPENS